MARVKMHLVELCNIGCTEGFGVHCIFIVGVTFIYAGISLSSWINFHLALEVVSTFPFM